KQVIFVFIKNIDSTKYIQATETYEGYLTKWTFSCKDVTFILDVFQEKSEISDEKMQQKAN
ncbi:4052_t:CDS:1, partial [Gigaspora rosea]